MTSPITPVPFPSPEEERSDKPDADEVRHTVAGITAAVTPPDGLTEVQHAVLNAHVTSMTDFPIEVTSVAPLGPEEFARGSALPEPGVPRAHGADHAARRDAARADPARGVGAGRGVRRLARRR